MKKWKEILGSVAPKFATALGGPFAGVAAKAITSAILGEESDDPEKAIKAIESASPEQLLNLKKAEQDFAKAMRELDVDLEKVHADDRSSARDLAKKGMFPQVILSVVFVVGYFIILYLKGTADFEIDGQTFGIITVSIPIIMQFWFGSSAGSKEKTWKEK